MARTKNFDIRLKVIDACLRGNKRFTGKEIMAKVNRELELEGEYPVSSRTTFQSDLLHIENKYHTEIIKERDGRSHRYYYADPEYSIYKVPLNDEQMANMTQTLMMLSQFDGLPQSDWIDEVIEKFKLSLNVDDFSQKVVGFDENLDLHGKHHFSTLLNAITQKRVLAITYRNFKTARDFKAIIHPYYLKQFNKRWFLFGWNEERDCLSNFAFDRILKIEYSDRAYIPNEDINFFDYFDEMVGVSRHLDSQSQKVRLWVSKNTFPYIETKPLHGTYHKVADLENGYEIEIDVIINYELKQLILSYGKDIRVIYPVSLRDEIKEVLQQSIDNYNLSSSTEQI